MVRVIVIAAFVLLGALPGVARAVCTACAFAVSASATGDLIQVVNAGSLSNAITFQIFDDAGVSQGSAQFTVGAGDRLVKKVGDIYAAAGVPSSAIKATWMQALEGGTDQMEMQIRTSGGAFAVPEFDVAGGHACH